MRNSRLIGRTVALAAIGLGAVVVAVLLLGGGDTYQLSVRFQNASQLVNGNLVQNSGAKVGQVTDIVLTDDGQAEVKVEIDEEFAPLREGTQAVVRQASLSGVANRYVDLRLPPGQPGAIPEGGVIDTDQTTTAVDLDQLFNVFGPKERKALSDVFRGSATQWNAESANANAGFRYLNPSLASTTRLFAELNSDTPLFERFIVANSQLVTDVADRRDDLAGLVDNLATTAGALANQKSALSESLVRLPDFMRRANSTFLNLRATLDDLDPLVTESRPVARKLTPFLRQLRPFTRDAQPTVRDLSRLVRSPQPDDDLIDLNNGAPPLRDIAVGTVKRNGKDREGALPAATRALAQATPELNFARPYAVDLTGWFNDFNSSGVFDALGGMSRVGTHASAFNLTGGASPEGIPVLEPLLPAARGEVLKGFTTRLQNDRCPGSMEVGAVYKPSPDYPCDETQVPPGG